LRRLENKRPTAVQFAPDHCFIFDEKGAARLTGNTSTRLKECLLLIDSNSAATWHPLLTLYTGAERAILMSSPNPAKWAEWMKQTIATCVISDLPTVPEIAAIL
jgi:hypothetical protein